jgi:hypothetical protein
MEKPSFTLWGKKTGRLPVWVARLIAEQEQEQDEAFSRSDNSSITGSPAVEALLRLDSSFSIGSTASYFLRTSDFN